jgi:hypothetical protein
MTDTITSKELDIVMMYIDKAAYQLGYKDFADLVMNRNDAAEDEIDVALKIAEKMQYMALATEIIGAKGSINMYKVIVTIVAISSIILNIVLAFRH